MNSTWDIAQPIPPAGVATLQHDQLLLALGLRGVIPCEPYTDDNLRKQLLPVCCDKAIAIIRSPGADVPMGEPKAPESSILPGPDAFVAATSREPFPMPMETQYSKVIVLETEPYISARLNDSSWEVYESFLTQLRSQRKESGSEGSNVTPLTKNEVDTELFDEIAEHLGTFQHAASRMERREVSHELIGITSALCIEDEWSKALQSKLKKRLCDSLKSAWLSYAQNVGRSGQQGVLASGLGFAVPCLVALDVTLRAQGFGDLTGTAAFVRHVARHGLRAAIEDVGDPSTGLHVPLRFPSSPPTLPAKAASSGSGDTAGGPRRGTRHSKQGGHSARQGREDFHAAPQSSERKDTTHSRRGRPTAGDMRAKRGRGGHAPAGRIPSTATAPQKATGTVNDKEEDSFEASSQQQANKGGSRNRRRRRRGAPARPPPPSSSETESSDEFEQYVKSMYSRGPGADLGPGPNDLMEDEDFLHFAAFMSGAGLMPEDVADMLGGGDMGMGMDMDMDSLFGMPPPPPRRARGRGRGRGRRR